MNQLFKKFSTSFLFLAFIGLWLTAGTVSAATKPAPAHVYSGRWVYTDATYIDYDTKDSRKWYLLCTPSGSLIEVKFYNSNYGLAVNVFDRKTGKPVFCDPTTGKVLE